MLGTLIRSTTKAAFNADITGRPRDAVIARRAGIQRGIDAVSIGAKRFANAEQKGSRLTRDVDTKIDALGRGEKRGSAR